MAEVNERVEVELENIERVVSELPDSDSLPKFHLLNWQELLLLLTISIMA